MPNDTKPSSLIEFYRGPVVLTHREHDSSAFIVPEYSFQKEFAEALPLILGYHSKAQDVCEILNSMLGTYGIAYDLLLWTCSTGHITNPYRNLVLDRALIKAIFGEQLIFQFGEFKAIRGMA